VDHDSVTLWLRQFSQGNQEAARRLWNRYSSALLRLAQDRYRGAVSAAADEEDLVQSVFQALWCGAADGRLDTVKDRTELWWLLMAITRRKAINRKAYNTRRKRGQQVRSLSQLETISGESSCTPPGSVADDQPPAELVLMLEEEQQRLLASLREDVLRSIAVWKMEGETHEQIAKKLGVTPRTVVRKLNLIRETWSKELEP
jgi:RNA polymerase sigma factor (sigma-70 family)